MSAEPAAGKIDSAVGLPVECGGMAWVAVAMGTRPVWPHPGSAALIADTRQGLMHILPDILTFSEITCTHSPVIRLLLSGIG